MSSRVGTKIANSVAVGMRALLLLAGLTIFASAPATFAQESDPAEEFATQVQGELQSADYQTDLPGPLSPPDPAEFEFPDWAKTLWKIFWWTATVSALAIIIYVVAKDIQARRHLTRHALEPARRPPPSLAQQPQPLRARVELSQIDGLVAKGEYGEAIHLLLAYAIQALAGRIKGKLADSLTSREILVDPRMQDNWRENFLPLVTATEAVLFAGQVADANLYKTCRSRLGALTQALWGRAR